MGLTQREEKGVNIQGLTSATGAAGAAATVSAGLAAAGSAFFSSSGAGAAWLNQKKNKFYSTRNSTFSASLNENDFF